MTEESPPKVENAPGLKFRQRKVGWYAYWQCRDDIAARGYKPPTVPLWRGIEPSRIDQTYISDQCVRMQNHMLVWSRDGVPEIIKFVGTVRSLINCYKTDPDAGYRALRYRTRENYDSLCRRIEKDLGDLRLEEIDARLIKRMHQGWTEGGKIAMAHSLVGMLRTLCTFGATMLKSKECRSLKEDLSDMKFTMPKARNETLTSDQAMALIAKAHEMNLPEVALCQAIQFECMLRQRDCIGEFVPDSEPGISDVTYAGEKWLRGLRWSEIDDSLILRHVTSKRQKEIEIDLRLAPMVLEQFKIIYGFDLAHGLTRANLPMSGPVIVYHVTRRPFITHQFRRIWRKVANAAGIPRHVKNMDSRSGAITEATNAGADLESIRHAATHSDIKMTSRYSRAAAEKTASVMQQRVAFRNRKGT